MQMRIFVAAMVAALTALASGGRADVGPLDLPLDGLVVPAASGWEEPAPEPPSVEGAVVVPVPPAIWTGLSTLTALAVLGWTRRRRRM